MKQSNLFFVLLMLCTATINAMQDITQEDIAFLKNILPLLRSSALGLNISINNSTHSDARSMQRVANIASQEHAHHQETDPKPLSPSWIQSLQSYIAQNKFKCIMGSLAACYFGLYFFIDRGYRLVRNCDGWCSWKDHIELAHLMCQNCDELAEELIKTIQEHCLNIKNLSNIQNPLAQFVREISDEQAELNRYIFLGSHIVAWRLSSIFPVNQKLLNQARMKLERLKFLRKLFMQWNTTHNMPFMKTSAY